MPSLNYFPDGEAIREFFEPAVKSPSIPLCKRGMTTDSPLWSPTQSGLRPGWQRGVRGDFSKIMAQLGFNNEISQEVE